MGLFDKNIFYFIQLMLRIITSKPATHLLLSRTGPVHHALRTIFPADPVTSLGTTHMIYHHILYFIEYLDEKISLYKHIKFYTINISLWVMMLPYTDIQIWVVSYQASVVKTRGLAL